VEGELFFASSNDLFTQFHYAEDPDRIVIDMYRSHVWDASTVAAIDSVSEKYTSCGKTVEVRGLNEASQRMRQRLSGTLGG
ncbi:STAS domain-containing protein, partial [Bacillus subtilis]|uniref:STAS domain-containing protein n=1 Tax=Bacillus subtilis TaxID=1423 RepID=UPI00397EE0E1